MAMFPDSGVPPGDAKNSLPDVNTNNCGELWYSTSRCQPRFDPAAANAMLAEDMNLIMKGELQYDCLRLDHIERAVRYIDQRGLPRAVYMQGGPQNYYGALDPGITRHNNYMTLTVVTAITNIAGGVTLDLGLGAVPIVRNDRQPLDSLDLRAGVPYIISFINGYWYMVGLAASQVPIIVKGGIDCWIRTDGNDLTGDGTLNTPEKAFKTILGCWNAVGSRFAATPLFSINMKLGIPGTYEGACIGPFGGKVSLTGNITDPGAYKITNVPAMADNSGWTSFWANSINQMTVQGVTLLMEKPTASGWVCSLRAITSSLMGINIRFEVLTYNSNSHMIEVGYGGTFATVVDGNQGINTVRVVGNNNEIGSIFNINLNSRVQGSIRQASHTSNIYVENVVLKQAGILCDSLSVAHMGSLSNISNTNVTGPKYHVTENSIVNMGGLDAPGDVSGTEAEGGRYIP